MHFRVIFKLMDGRVLGFILLAWSLFHCDLIAWVLLKACSLHSADNCVWFLMVGFTVLNNRFERERTCPLCRAVVKSAGLRSYGDGSTNLFIQLF
jgi:hypothetical protein